MKTYACLLLVVAVLVLGGVTPVMADAEEILQPLRDELGRTLSDLVMEDLERPFYVSYTIDDIVELTIDGALGTLTRSTLERSRYLTTDLRVGDQVLDNSNFVAGYYRMPPPFTRIAVDNNYDAIRNVVFLESDKAYKRALKTLSQKRAYLQTRVMKNRPNDMVTVPSSKTISPAVPLEVNQERYEEMVRAASEVFREYPMILSADIELRAVACNQYFVSLTSEAVRPDVIVVIDLVLRGKSVEGEDVADADRLIARRDSDLPDHNALIAWAREHAETMKATLAAESIEEYAGPVILDGRAAGEFFRQLFAQNISDCPGAMFENDNTARQSPTAELGGKVKRRVLPAFFDVYDDPTIDRLGEVTLVGSYPVDDAGVPAQRITLVEKGKLVSLPLGLAATKKVTEPNGHGRGAVSKEVTGRPANLVFESSDQVEFEQLKATMLEMCLDVDLEYGLVIERLEDADGLPGEPEVFRFFGGGAAPESKLTAPLRAYKIYADGHTEPVRNLQFSNVTIRTLRDILQTGNKLYGYDYLIEGDYEMPATIVTPALLIEEMELKKSEAKVKKPPVLTSPLADR